MTRAITPPLTPHPRLPLAHAQEGMLLTIESYKGVPAVIVLPLRAAFKAVELEPTSSTALLSNGLRVRVR